MKEENKVKKYQHDAGGQHHAGPKENPTVDHRVHRGRTESGRRSVSKTVVGDF